MRSLLTISKGLRKTELSRTISFETLAAGPEIKARKVSKVGLKVSATEPDAAVPKARRLRDGFR